MSRKTEFILMLGLFIFLFLIGPSLGNSEELVCKKTVTLSDGEVICDLNGEWDLDYTPLGPAQTLGQQNNILQITQQGRLFKGIATNNSKYASKGFWAIGGEIERDGFKKFSVFANGDFPGNSCGGDRQGCSVRISKDGNRIEFKALPFLSVELNRR